MDGIRSLTATTPVAVPYGDFSDQLDPADRAILALGLHLKQQAYKFTTISPTSHCRVLAREYPGRRSIEDVLGWNREFSPAQVAQTDLKQLTAAGVLEGAGALLRSNIRLSTLGCQHFVHSPFPTVQPDAVFFGPDTYRFARFIDATLEILKLRDGPRRMRILDIGAGTGAGGLHAAARAAEFCPSVTLSDINRRALRFCRINAALNAVPDVTIVESDLFEHIPGLFDLIIGNPPYLVDPFARTYRHGGGAFGAELSLRLVTQGVSRLAPGGRLLLYTGSAIVNGFDLFHEALMSGLAGRDVRVSYEEIDPDVFGEELEHPPYDRADRLAVVGVTIDID